jgi:hypothetical protein
MEASPGEIIGATEKKFCMLNHLDMAIGTRALVGLNLGASLGNAGTMRLLRR